MHNTLEDMPKLSILIPSLHKRAMYLEKILFSLEWQRKQLANPDDVEIVQSVDNGERKTGWKRNWLIANSTGESFMFVDDDDEVSPTYLALNLKGHDTGADCNSLTGIYVSNGVFGKPFIHSIKYNSAWEDSVNYYRAPNHLNRNRRDRVGDILFEEKNFGEDGCWMEAIQKQGRLRNEHWIPELQYLYYCVPK